MGNLEYGHGQLVKKVITVSDVEVADGIVIREIGPKVSAVEGQVQVVASQMIQAVSRLEQVRAHVEQGHAGDPEVSYWLKGRGGNLRAQKDDLEFVINQRRVLNVGDAPHHREPSLLSYK
ncbi:hypothetical protein Tco_1098036 [Tanacetum coccineum]